MSRFLTGVGVGTVTYVLPIFISELAPPESRGALGCMMQLTCVTGSLIAGIANVPVSVDYHWSLMGPAIPAAIVCLGIFCCPQSPRFLLTRSLRKGNADKGQVLAREALMRIRGTDAERVNVEIQELKACLEMEATQAPWSTLWKDRSIWRRVLIANMLQWTQQFTGINALLSYGPAIFLNAGVPLDPFVCNVIICIVNLLFTGVMMLVIDRMGRRRLLLLGATGMFVFMSLSAFLAWAIQEHWGDDIALGWALLGTVSLYVAFFAVAWGGVPWVYPSEIFPMDVKEKALSTSVFSQWIANCVIAFLVPEQVNILKVPGTLLFYAAFLALAIPMVYLWVPETKGLPLEQMDEVFGARVAELPLASRRSPAGEPEGLSPAPVANRSFGASFGVQDVSSFSSNRSLTGGKILMSRGGSVVLT